VALAAHADELVDRHRRGSVGTYPDTPQTGSEGPASRSCPARGRARTS
jgi:hypothetical protein